MWENYEIKSKTAVISSHTGLILTELTFFLTASSFLEEPDNRGGAFQTEGITQEQKRGRKDIFFFSLKEISSPLLNKISQSTLDIKDTTV